MTTLADRISSFLRSGPWAVVGASNDRAKFGNRVLRCYLEHGLDPVHPVNPNQDEIEGLVSYPDLEAVPGGVRAVSVITQPAVTEAIVEQAAAAGVFSIWMQPGAESHAAIELAEELGLEVIAGGPCILVELGCS